MGITVRVVVVGDADSVAALSGQLGYTVSVADTAQSIAVINSSDNDVAYVAVDEDTVIGWIHVFCTLRLESAAFCEIGGLVVNESHRGKGIGRMLIEHARPWCAQKKCAVLKVRSNIKRSDAHAFYEHAGFKSIKQQMVFEMVV